MKDKHFLQDNERYSDDDSSHFMKELDKPLNDIELLELQGHLVEVIEQGYEKADRDSVVYVAKFLRKNFI